MVICSLRAIEIVTFIFACSFVVAAFAYFPHAIDTGFSWLITSLVTFEYSFVVRQERLETLNAYPIIKRNETFQSSQFLVLAFFVWSLVNLALALTNQDGLDDMGSKWMTFISTLMGFKWSFLLMRRLNNLTLTAEDTVGSRRGLLSPIGEIA